MERGLFFWVENSGKNFCEWHHGYCLRLIINSEAGVGNHSTGAGGCFIEKDMLIFENQTSLSIFVYLECILFKSSIRKVRLLISKKLFCNNVTLTNFINMKKIITIVFFTSILFGCSSSDSNSSDGTYFMRININGTEYYNEVFAYITHSDITNCSNNGELTLTRINQVETSTLFVETGFAHFSNAIDFDNPQKNIITNTIFKDDNFIWGDFFNPNLCERNNDFSIIIETKPSNQRLYLKPNTTPTHSITNVSLVSEDAAAKIYKVEGNFNAIYLNGNNDLPVSGNYRVQLEVFK